MTRASSASAAAVQPARKSRTRPLIDSVRHSTLSLVNCNSYLPATLVRRVKIEAIDRDAAIRMLNDSRESVNDWPGSVVPISGASGVIAQVLSDHFAALDTNTQLSESAAPVPDPELVKAPKRATGKRPAKKAAARTRRTRS